MHDGGDASDRLAVGEELCREDVFVEQIVVVGFGGHGVGLLLVRKYDERGASGDLFELVEEVSAQHGVSGSRRPWSLSSNLVEERRSERKVLSTYETISFGPRTSTVRLEIEIRDSGGTAERGTPLKMVTLI